MGRSKVDQRGRKVTWVAATRGDFLLLGPAFKEFKKRRTPGTAHWLMDSGETGMAALQARDLLGLAADETGELCHPADEPAIRLSLMLARSEGFIRRHKGTHAIFTGFGQTAAATAIYCHARGCKGLWLRPPDPAGIVGRLRWESGLERMIRACAPCVETWQVPGAPDWRSLVGTFEAGFPEAEIPGLRAGTPRVVVAMLRREWGVLDDGTERLARAAASWARAWPAVDFLVISNLNARLEGPVRSMPARPANLALAPPLPYPVYDRVLEEARLVLTDGPLLAAEALARGLPVATLGDFAAEESLTVRGWHRALQPADLESEPWVRDLESLLAAGDGAPRDAPRHEDPVFPQMIQAIERFLG